MKHTEFETAYDKIEAEKIICVLSASTFENGYWKHYHASAYRVVNITPKEINLQNVNHLEEWMTLTPKNLKTGQFYIEY